MKIIFSIVAAAIFSACVSAAPLNKIVVFGDSLSDNGNLYEYMKHQLPLSPPYFAGRFTNGPVWIERLASYYYPDNVKSHMLNYAFGGAGVLEDDDVEDGFFTLHGEIDSYLLTHNDKADEKSLYVVWIGSNNYLAIPENTDKALADVAIGMQHSLQRLVDKGAKYILVLNVPNLGSIPAARDFNAVDELAYLSAQHNQILAKNIKEFERANPSVHWIYLDVNLVFDDMFVNPQHYGLTNVTGTCYEEYMPSSLLKSKIPRVLQLASTVKPKISGPDACDGFLFFDPVHPSALVHNIMAEKAKELFDAADIEFE